MRTLVDIPEDRLAELDEYRRRVGKSRAEVIREAIRAYLRDKVAATDDAFAIWADRGIDALAYEAELRGEWEPPQATQDGQDASALRHQRAHRLPKRNRRRTG